MHPLIFLLCTFWFAVLLVALVDCLRSNNQNKAGWIAVIVLLPLLGSVLYFRLARGRYVSEL